MSALEDFLGLTDVSEMRETITIDINGKKLDIVVRPITESEHSEFQRRCNIINKNKISFDQKKYNDLILSSCIVEPEFNTESFLKKAGCQTAVEFLNKKFPAGVLTDIVQKIQKLSGFESFEMEIETAKN